MRTAAHPCYPFTQVLKALLEQQDEPGERRLPPQCRYLIDADESELNSAAKAFAMKAYLTRRAALASWVYENGYPVQIV